MDPKNESESIDSKYKILKKRGKGLTSRVYKVKDNDSENIYAAKVFKKSSKLFQNEVDILNTIKELNNIYIINIKDSGYGKIIRKNTEHNKQYIISEFASKGELDEYIFLVFSPLKELHAKFIFSKILKGVQAFHKIGICHRDLKLKNILLDDSFTPKICDFGFATKNKENLCDFLGTYSYAAPEIYLRRPYNGFKVDIFSLGVILLNLTACKYGFNKAVTSDKDYIKIMMKSYAHFWAILLGNTKKLSDELKKLYVKMVAYNPSERPTIEEILESDWMKELNEMNEEQLEELENEIREEFLKREKLVENFKKIKKEINNNYSTDYNSSSITKGISKDKNMFFLNSKPSYAKSDLNMDYCIKLTGNINPCKLMNNLIEEIKNIDDCDIHVSEEDFKFSVSFKKSEEYFEITEEMKEEIKKLGITEEEINIINNDQNENIKGKKIVIQIKIYEMDNGGYLLKFVKKEGELIDYIEKIEKINFLIK